MKLTNPTLLQTLAYIGGHWVESDNGTTYPVHNPATGELIAEVASCGQQETQRAVSAASLAHAKWSKTTAKHRAGVLRRWYELMEKAKEDLAMILTAEQGKPLVEARGEIAYGASYLEWFAEECKRVNGDILVTPSQDKRAMVIKQPVGVVACITPWNFPNAMLARKVAPAIAAGCAVVCKPANQTPLSAFAIAKLAEDAGVPAGLINIVSGNTQEIGAVLTGSPIVRKLTFTGSTAVGKTLMEQCAGTVKRTSMELGGNAPFIVLDDADIDEAVKGAIICKYRNAGQTCVAANRIMVQSGVYDVFVEKFLSAVSALKLGDGSLEDINVGPVIHPEAALDVIALVDDATTNGATLVAGDTHVDAGSSFVQPMVLTNVTGDMRVCNEEIFGPVAPLIRFETEDEAIILANNTTAGLAAYFYSRDIGRVWRIAEALEYGIIGINEGIISNEMAPFGGIKESGHGREGSKYGMDDYLDIKYLCLGGLD